MAYKTGGIKAHYTSAYGYIVDKYVIYCAIESVSDTIHYRMFDEHGKEIDIEISAEEDSSNGKYSLVDVLYYLKHYYDSDKGKCPIQIEEMTDKEMQRIFGY